MDGLKDIVPTGKPYEEFHQMTFGELFSSDWEEAERKMEEAVAIPAVTYNWRSKLSVLFRKVKEKTMGKKLFDFVIGNPPYQGQQNSEDTAESKKNFAPPIYNFFMDETYKISSKVELIHPARFLFNAGSTKKNWNEKMLNDPHLKVLRYEAESSKIFPGLSTPIKGGIAITYHDETKDYGAIKIIVKYETVNSVVHKVLNSKDFVSLMDIVYSRTAYRMNDKMHLDFPNAIGKLSKGHAYDVSSNIFDRIPEVFYDECPSDGSKYVKIVGRSENKRIYKYIKREYLNDVENLESYKILISQANGDGSFGEALSKPLVEGPY